MAPLAYVFTRGAIVNGREKTEERPEKMKLETSSPLRPYKNRRGGFSLHDSPIQTEHGRVSPGSHPFAELVIVPVENTRNRQSYT